MNNDNTLAVLMLEDTEGVTRTHEVTLGDAILLIDLLKNAPATLKEFKLSEARAVVRGTAIYAETFNN